MASKLVDYTAVSSLDMAGSARTLRTVTPPGSDYSKQTSGIRPVITPNPVEDELTPGAPDTHETHLYFVLHHGEILGPFTFKRLLELALGKTVSADDFVQKSGSFEWVPLRWVLDPENAPREDGAHAPPWKTLLSWCWLRLRYNLDERSLSAGLICLGFSIAGVLLSHWPVIFWAPWSIFAFVAGVALSRRNHMGSGIGLMLASASVPVAIWWFFFHR